WLVDLGPEGGDGGGRIVATGTPEQIAAESASHTGRYLAAALAGAAGDKAAKRRAACRARPAALVFAELIDGSPRSAQPGAIARRWNGIVVKTNPGEHHAGPS